MELYALTFNIFFSLYSMSLTVDVPADDLDDQPKLEAILLLFVRKYLKDKKLTEGSLTVKNFQWELLEDRQPTSYEELAFEGWNSLILEG